MKLSDITNEDLDRTLEVLEAILDDTREREPGAFNAIAAFEQAIENMPRDINDLK